MKKTNKKTSPFFLQESAGLYFRYIEGGRVSQIHAPKRYIQVCELNILHRKNSQAYKKLLEINQRHGVTIETLIESGELAQKKFKNLPIAKLLHNTWGTMKTILDIKGFFDFTPIWGNHNYEELQSIPDNNHWKRKGIHFLAQIIDKKKLCTFETLKRVYGVEEVAHFRYFQLFHAFCTIKDEQRLKIESHECVDYIRLDCHSGKKIISRLYEYLNDARVRKLKFPATAKWEEDNRRKSRHWRVE